MSSITTPDIRETIEAGHYGPAVSVIIPFEPKMGLRKELSHSLKVAVDEVELQLLMNYPAEMVSLMTGKLTSIIQDLNFNTHKKSIAIYVSPVFQKILYLDIPVEKKIMVDKSFEIRDLVYSKQQIHKYLVLLLNEKHSRIFLGNTETFLTLVSNSVESVSNYINDMPEKVANFSDGHNRHEILMDKFLHYVDNGLSLILNAYRLPLFVIGSKKMLGHFKNVTKHSQSIIEFIYKDYKETDIKEIRQALAPHINDWKKIIQRDIINKLGEAAGKKKLSTGMKEVWKEAMNHKGRLLVVEKNYMYAAENTDEKIHNATGPYNKFSYIKDAVDDVIEKVLEAGGDVEFVDDDMLNEYHHVALIQYY